MDTDSERWRGVLHEEPEGASTVAPTASKATPQDGLPTPDRAMEVAFGFMASKFMFTGIELGLFTAVGTDGVILEEIAARCGAPVRTLRVIVNGLVLFGLLERDGERYRNPKDIEAFLTDRALMDMRPLLRYFDQVSYPSWEELARSVRTGKGTRKELDAAENELYETGVAVATKPGAVALPDVYDFSPHRRVLDVGGGAGMFLTEILARHEHLTGTLLDLPATGEFARGELAGQPTSDRIDVVGADMFTDSIPDGHDAFLLANLVHLFPPEDNLALLRRLREVAPDGARLLLLDWWLDPDALHPNTVTGAAEWLTMSGGCAYTADEVGEWCGKAGWRLVDQRLVVSPMSLLVAEAV